MEPPSPPRLFLIDGYALIYRAFFALISRPLTTSRGENTSAAWGIVTFLQRLLNTHKPEYLGWVHDSGLSFRHERYPAYKATREKLTEELQSDFDRGMERIVELLDAFRIPILTVPGFEADDVIGTLVKQSVAQKLNVVVVSGDKDFQQLVQAGVWLLNPGRGGPAGVEEQWVGVENGAERLGVPPDRVTDYLALVGDSSDNVPGVRGIGDKTARDLVSRFGSLESILAAANEITQKRPREALLEHGELARLSKELVTIRDDLPIDLTPDRFQLRQPDFNRLKELYVALEFHSLAKEVAGTSTAEPTEAEVSRASYTTVDTVEGVNAFVEKARRTGSFSLDTETVVHGNVQDFFNPLRATLVSVACSLAPGEAYYFPLRHRERAATQGSLLIDIPGDRSSTDGPEDRGFFSGGDEVASSSATKKRKTLVAKAGPTSIAGRAFANGAQGPVRNLPPLDDPQMHLFRELLEDQSVRKTIQNAKYDLLVFRSAGVTVRGLDFDTMLGSYVLDPGRRSHGLDVLSLEFLDHSMTSIEDLCGRGKNAVPFDECPVESAAKYSCEDADMTGRLREVFEPQLESHRLSHLLRDIELPLVNVLADMEWTGVSIDLGWFRSLKERFVRERENVEQQIYSVAGTQFNINSNIQLREILFTRLGLPTLKKTSTGPSTDASVLQELADAGHALPSLLMEYRELAKLENTYLDALPALVNPKTGRLHTSFSQTVASTGRLSSSSPNLQNIPIRRELGRDIRRGFIPRRGWKFLAADYSQIELRLLAHLSNDSAFVAAFNAGGDIHRQTASIIFDVPVDSVTSEMRGRAKTINFATIYGQGPHALSRQLKIEHAEARSFIATYFERFKGVREYLDSMVEFAREHGYVETIFGRRRYIPELRDRNFNIRAFGERVAANSPIQGSAADLIKIAMIRIHNLMQKEKYMSRMLLQVHDELVFEVAPDELDQVSRIVRHEMENAVALSVPLVVDVGIGDNWLETKL